MRPASSPAPARRVTKATPDAPPPARVVSAWPAVLAAVCCVLIALLAIAPGVRAQGGEGISLLFVAASGILVLLSPLRRLFFPRDERDEPRARGAATFALACALSVLFPIARRYAPFESLALRVPGLEETFPISLASVVALGGALLTIGPTLRALSGIVRATVVALAILVALGLGSFWLLGRFYVVGATEQVDPTPLVQLVQQAIEWGAVILLCHAATTHRKVRGWILSAMIVMLLLVWARQQSLPPVVDDE